jgi:L-arabinose isomerase
VLVGSFDQFAVDEAGAGAESIARNPGEWVEDWSASGIGHHWALATGHRVADLRAVADLLGLGFTDVV